MAEPDIAALVRGLVDIARVAQPPEIFAVDPRVRKALAFLGAQTTRVPNTARDALGPEIAELLRESPVDLGQADPNNPVTLHLAREMAFQDIGLIELDIDLVQPLAEAQKALLPPEPSAALNAVIRDWLEGHGFLEPSPETARVTLDGAEDVAIRGEGASLGDALPQARRVVPSPPVDQRHWRISKNVEQYSTQQQIDGGRLQSGFICCLTGEAMSRSLARELFDSR